MEIKYVRLIISFIAISCLGCNSPIKERDNSQKGNAIAPSTIIESVENRDVKKWINYYNLKSDSLKYLYAQNAIKILENGAVLNGRDQIVDNILKSMLVLNSIERVTMIVAHKERAIEYEISENIYENDLREKTLTIWQTKNTERKRVFEFVSKVKESTLNHLALNERRELWMSLCNKHNAKNLIDELYSENTLYFNHKPIIKGRAQLVGEYAYMNNENYALTLEPEVVDKVNEGIIFEMGQCSGSYNGKYILIWRKDQDGEWRIFIDSNI